jgi:hypothetical protein
MKKNNPVLIIEHCTSGLKPINESVSTSISNTKKEYLLGGVFTEFNIVNRNERIYTADKFLPHVSELLERKKTMGVIYGEFDHPDVFDTSLSRVSHTVENVFYVKEKNRVDGEIRLLSTHWGREAKALVDDGCPIFVSSRAAGITESDGTVTVKKLFTYDAVADPGFSSARMEVKSMNESLGLPYESANFRIYDISDESKINELFNMQGDFVTKQQMTEYSDYLTKEIENVKSVLSEGVKNGNAAPEQIERMAEILENMREQQEKVADYLDYLAEKVQVVVNENVQLKETSKKLIEHNDYLAETLEKSINYTEYLAENLDKNIDYAEYVAETLDKNIDFAEYIAEHVNKNIEFSDYLAENLEKNINYSEYIAENLDNSIVYAEYLAENLDNSIVYSEYLAENVDNNIAYAEYLAENLDTSIEYVEYVAEHLDNNIAYAEYIAENVSDTQAYTKYLAEGLDNTIETLKTSKLNESVQLPDMKLEDVTRFYDDDDDFRKPAVADAPVQADAAVTEPVQGEVKTTAQVQTPEGEAQVDVQTPVQGEIATEPIPGETLPVSDETPSIEGEPAQEIVPGTTGSYEGKPAEVMAYSPETQILVLKLSETGEEIETTVQEKKFIVADNILNENSFTKYVAELITETKKRKAAETQEPHYLQFLSEKYKQAWRGLSPEDKEKVTFAINESEALPYTESDVLKIMNDALSVNRKSFEELLLENMPTELKSYWNNLNENYKSSILNQAKLYPTMDTAPKFESFWRTRRLEEYALIKENKQVLNENVLVDNSKLSEQQIDDFIAKIKNLE